MMKEFEGMTSEEIKQEIEKQNKEFEAEVQQEMQEEGFDVMEELQKIADEQAKFNKPDSELTREEAIEKAENTFEFYCEAPSEYIPLGQLVWFRFTETEDGFKCELVSVDTQESLKEGIATNEEGNNEDVVTKLIAFFRATSEEGEDLVPPILMNLPKE